MKLVITVLATLILLVHTQPIDLLAGAAAKTAVLSADLHGAQFEMVIASSAALGVLLVLTVLSVYKPRGMTPYGQRKQDEQRKDVTGCLADTSASWPPPPSLQRNSWTRSVDDTQNGGVGVGT